MKTLAGMTTKELIDEIVTVANDVSNISESNYLMDVREALENKINTPNGKIFRVYLALSGEFDDSYTDIRKVDSVVELTKTSVLINGTIEVDFGNEILSVWEVPQ